jgi:hypothetical protein
MNNDIKIEVKEKIFEHNSKYTYLPKRLTDYITKALYTALPFCNCNNTPVSLNFLGFCKTRV